VGGGAGGAEGRAGRRRGGGRGGGGNDVAEVSLEQPADEPHVDRAGAQKSDRTTAASAQPGNGDNDELRVWLVGWEVAKQRKRRVNGALESGFADLAELRAAKLAGFEDKLTFTVSTSKGFEDKRTFDEACELGFVIQSSVELKSRKSGESTLERAWPLCTLTQRFDASNPRHDVLTHHAKKRAFDEARLLGFRDYATFARFKRGGFEDRATFKEAKHAGFSVNMELLEFRQKGFADKEKYVKWKREQKRKREEEERKRGEEERERVRLRRVLVATRIGQERRWREDDVSYHCRC